MENYINYLVKWIKENVDNSKSKGVVFGLSGGIDSSLVGVLLKKAFPNNHIGIIMPCDSNPQDKEDALLFAKKFNINIIEIDLTNIWKDLIKKTNTKNIFSNANTKSRLRMTTLYNIAQENSYLVVGTSNRDEIYLGYFTKYGDGSSDILPIGNLSKIEIFKLSKFLDINENIINKKPSAGLFKDQTDEDDMGVTYEDVNNYLSSNEVSKDVKLKIKNIHLYNKHKIINVPKPKSMYDPYGDKRKMK